jgi:hypothetical protein
VALVDADAYCREIEAHLCRRNAGHMVRVVGPAFELVAGWAAKGIPLKVALHGIDQCIDRRAAKGPSRRPLRVEFCDADVLDAFDQWRRAVGIGTAGGGALPAPGASEDEAPASRSKPGHSLRAHLDRVVTRLTDRVAAGSLGPSLEPAVESLIVELGRDREASRSLRGEARAQFVERLQALDRRLMDAARSATPSTTIEQLAREADLELSGFKGRMSAEDYSRAVAAAATKLLRDHWKLPVVVYEG